MTRAFAASLLFAVISVVVAPSSRELHTRYGEPTLERFTARDGISVSVKYGSDGAACVILIEPPRPLSHANENAPLMLSDTVTAVLEELAPVQTRGLPINSAISSMGCSQSIETDYLDLKLVRDQNSCISAKPEHEVRATLTYNRDICRIPRKSE